MKNLLIIFRGWSSTPNLYKRIEKIYNDFKIIYSEELDKVKISEYEKISVLAWSMGTLDAMEYERMHKVDEMILISPTLDFTYDTRPIILKKMIKRLGVDREGCLKDFTSLCFDSENEAMRYWKEYRKDILDVSDEVLIGGLIKLMEKKLENKSSGMNTLIITARNDRVISNKNSMNAAKNYPKGKVVELDGGHNLFYDKMDELLQVIKKNRGGRDATLKI